MYFLIFNLNSFGITLEFFTGAVLLYLAVFGTVTFMYRSSSLLQKVLIYSVFLVLTFACLLLFSDFFFYCYKFGSKEFSILPISEFGVRVDEIERFYSNSSYAQINESNQIQNTKSYNAKQPSILATSNFFNHLFIIESHKPFYDPKMGFDWNNKPNCVYPVIYFISDENLKYYYQTLYYYNYAWKLLGDDYLKTLEMSDDFRENQLMKWVEAMKWELEEIRDVLEKVYYKPYIKEDDLIECCLITYQKIQEIKVNLNHFYRDYHKPS